jgi:hypothetical protein
MAGSQPGGPIGTDPATSAPRTPGPLGKNDAADPSLDVPVGDTPGPLGDKDAAAAQAAKASAATDPDIEALSLADTAKTAAYALKKQFPDIVFTSGRRDKAEQASAMASNVVSNRQWIGQTYMSNDASKACQKWVDDHPEAKKKSEISDGLKGVLDALTDDQLGQLSKHLSGEAFDVQPVTKDADKIKAAINALPGLGKFLDKEGGLVRWHAQF